ncbi:MAG: Cell division protein FtsL [uncultured Caballeronia sp.]|nr:MAG: Cell division protein FtsL [uncultured Caballeronia sp.]
MNRLNIFLLIVVLGCALSAVSASNKQRQIFIDVQRAQSEERQLQQDFSQLQYQQSALSKTSRIEQLATTSLKMQPVTTGRTQYQYLNYDPATSKATDAPLPAPVPASAPPARGVKR